MCITRTKTFCMGVRFGLLYISLYTTIMIRLSVMCHMHNSTPQNFTEPQSILSVPRNKVVKSKKVIFTEWVSQYQLV